MSNAMSFRKATKLAAKLRLALVGPPGSGKTFTSLKVATSLGGNIAFIDTEKGSASKYADVFQFDVLELEGSFHPRRYVEAIHAAEQAGYTTIIVDSLSHAWIGEEGGLDLHDKAVARQKTKNSYTAWGDVTPHHNALVQGLVQCKCHLIATMRSKVEYVQEKDDKGRTSIRKVGTSPLMRDGVEYEFDLVGDMDIDHTLIVTKSRCHVLADGVFRKPGEAFVKPLLAWLGGNPPPANGNGNGNGTEAVAAIVQKATPPQLETIADLGRKCFKSKDELKQHLLEHHNITLGKPMTVEQADSVIADLRGRVEEIEARKGPQVREPGVDEEEEIPS